MKNLMWVTCLAASFALLGCDRDSGNSGASTGDQNSSYGTSVGDSSSNAVDNTGRNVRDRADSALTPLDQGGSEADRAITQRIRQAITGNDQLSTDAKNIKIITQNGKVTLRGPVQNDQELKTIETIVQQAGVTTFDNQLEVKASE